MFTGNNSKQDQFVPQQMNYNETKYTVSSIFDLNVFPPLLRDVILSLHIDTQVSIDLITSVVLAATSLAYQPLIKVVPPHSTIPEPCSLYFLTLAESGGGKTTINELVMKPFYDFLTESKEEYDAQLIKYKEKYDIWKVKKQALDSNLRKSIRNDINSENDEYALEEHMFMKPIKPLEPCFIHEDTTPKSLLEGLCKCPDAGIISDESIVFFKGYIKNNYGVLNKAWDGSSYSYKRANKESKNIKPTLTISLMVQPIIFQKYLDKYGEEAKGSGFLSRFLFSSIHSNAVKNTQAFISNNTQGFTNKSTSPSYLKNFHDFLWSLLQKRKKILTDQAHQVKILKLQEASIMEYANIRSLFLINPMIIESYKNISDVISKASANTLRLAAIFHEANRIEGNELSIETLNNAKSVITSYMNQAHEIFYSMSEFNQIEKDAKKLYAWIMGRFHNGNYAPFLKSDIEKSGPNSLRKIDKLEPILNIVISYSAVRVIQKKTGGPKYISFINTYNYCNVPQGEDIYSFHIIPVNPSNNPNGVIPYVDFKIL
ncbi:DUF3987 domain-containing protein [Morganella morganii]|uniref:DUF3987 domain-containing protein n=3 Tax=Morganellaceae TaxID=1903414 RepID=UPI0029E52BC7|nr:DUF3987 domain-containing protein [Providencia rettgeri]MDY3693556.1 DUF3987 domain-containing protein [Proteus mirabilis]